MENLLENCYCYSRRTRRRAPALQIRLGQPPGLKGRPSGVDRPGHHHRDLRTHPPTPENPGLKAVAKLLQLHTPMKNMQSLR